MQYMLSTLFGWCDDSLSKLCPDLAESWSAKDNQVFTFKLRKDVTWHDGEKFNADDVVFTLQRHLCPKCISTKTALLGNIKGAKAYKAGTSDTLEGLRKIDDYTVEIALEKADPLFLQLMASTPYFIAPEHILASVPPDQLEQSPWVTKQPIGTGPYKLVKWEVGQYEELERYDGYYHGRPHIEKVIFTHPAWEVGVAALESGELDIARVQVEHLPRLRKVQALNTMMMPVGLQVSLHVNQANPKFPEGKDLRFRQAIAYAIDRDRLMSEYYQGVYKKSDSLFNAAWLLPLPDDIKALAYNFNPDKSRALLKEMGWDSNRTIGYYKPTSFWFPADEIVISMLADVGIKVEARKLEVAALNEVRKNYEWEMIGLNSDCCSGIQASLWHDTFGCDRLYPTGNNQNGVCSQEAEDLGKKAEAATALEDQVKYYQGIARLYLKELWSVPVYREDWAWAFNKRVHGTGDPVVGFAGLQGTVAHFEDWWLSQ